MSICSVCGNKVKNVNMNIVRGKSGEWVCKECLKKAGIGVMKFSSTDIPAGQIMAMINGTDSSANTTAQTNNSQQPKFCQNCGSKLEGNFCSNCGASVNNAQPQNTNNGGMRCPKCHSNNLQIISDVKGKGVSATNLCLCGLLGLAGVGKTKTTHYWICSNCGNKFKA